MSDYTPTVGEVRADYVRDHTRGFDSYLVGRSRKSEEEAHGARFDRFIAKVKADAWMECAYWHAEQGRPVVGSATEHNPYRGEEA